MPPVVPTGRGACLRLPSAIIQRFPPPVGDIPADDYDFRPGARPPAPAASPSTPSPMSDPSVPSAPAPQRKKPPPLPILGMGGRAAAGAQTGGYGGGDAAGGWFRWPSGVLQKPIKSIVGEGTACDDDPIPKIESSNFDRRDSDIRRSKLLLEHNSSVQLHDLYELSEPLGVGGFGTVWKARLKTTDVWRAVKSIKNKSAAVERSVRHEADVLRRLDHPHICRILEAFYSTGVCYLVMEFVDGKELFDHIQEIYSSSSSVDEGFGAQIFRMLFSALEYCHNLEVIHRDLKPENVLIQRVPVGMPQDHVEIRLIDFGLAVLYQHTDKPSFKDVAGTYVYMAPEVRSGIDVAPASDQWSAGVVLHTLLVGSLPREEVRHGEEGIDLKSEDYDSVSDPAKEVLAGLLRVEATQRLTAGQALKLSWLQQSRRNHKAVPSNHMSMLTSSFSNFKKVSILQRAMLTAFASQLASEKLGDLREQFFACDEDHNGRISRQELVAFLGTQPGGAMDVAEWVDSVFGTLDSDGSQELEYTEWVAAAVKDGAARSESNLRAAFRSCDADGSGLISNREVMRLLSSTPMYIISDAMKEFDTDGDGELSFEEFVVLIKKSLPSINAVDRASPRNTQ